MKRNNYLYVILIIAGMLSLTGCSHDFSDWLADQLYGAETEATVPEIPAEPEEAVEAPTVETEVTPVQQVEEEPLITVLEETETAEEAYEGVSEEGLAEAAQTQTDSYAYSTLNTDEQRVYLEILTILRTMGQNITVSSTDTNQIDKVFKSVMLDHPEIFYVQGYSMTKLTRAGILNKITLSGTYTMSQTEKAEKERLAAAAAANILSPMPGGASEYDKVKFVYEYLVLHTEYDVASEQNQNILSVFLNGRSVCQGYAKAAQYLLNQTGIFCTLAEGVVKGNEPHVWNIVRIDGAYYNMDVTWGDASYNITGIDASTGNASVPEINYDYLNIPDSMIRTTHAVNSPVILPICDSMAANYYVREGIYLTEFNENQLAGLFSSAYANGKTTVQLKCADANVYQAYYQHLITNEKIFDYLNGGSSVRYVEMREQLSMLFYL